MTLNFYTTTSCPNVVENKMFSVFFPVMDDMGKFKSTTTLCTPWTTLAFARLTDSNASACQDIQPSAATPSNLITPHPPPTLCLLWKWISNTKIALKSAASPAGRFWLERQGLTIVLANVANTCGVRNGMGPKRKGWKMVASARIWPRGRKWFACVPPRRKGTANRAEQQILLPLPGFGLLWVPLHPRHPPSTSRTAHTSRWACKMHV